LVYDADTLTLDRGKRRQGPHLAQPLVGAGRQVEPRRVGPIDDVDVVIARNQQNEIAEGWVVRHSIEEFSPFARSSGVRHIAGNQYHIERVARMQMLQLFEYAANPLVAARARPAALESKTVPLAHNVEIRQVRDTPAAAFPRSFVERFKIARRTHGRVSNRPDQRGNGHIGTDQDELPGKPCSRAVQ
jgi:hypothetical protein